jgi:hemerythrin-like domain-containing protein
MPGLCDSLVREHETIERALDMLEARARAVAEGAPVDTGYFTAAIGFVRHFADGLHHQKEEQVLFPALCEAGMPRDAGPVAVMLSEHDEGRGHIRAMEVALTPAAGGDMAARRQLIREALAYVALLRAHIQ